MTDHTILRVVKDADHPYSVISNALIQNSNLSWEARGVMCYLLSKPDNWKVRVSDLVSSGKCKLYGIRTILAELEGEGYITRRRFRSEDGTYHCETEVRETPRQASADPSTMDRSTVDSPAVESVQHLTSTDLPSTDSSTNGVPLVDASVDDTETTPLLDSRKKTPTRNPKPKKQKNIPPTDGDAPPSDAQRHREMQTDISAYFQKLTGLILPLKADAKAMAKLWWNPIREICENADWNIQVARKLIASSVTRLRRDNMTISNPNSLIKTVVGIRAEWRSGTSPPSPPSRPLTGGSWRSPLTGEEHYEGKPRAKDTR
jgi:hypothetical protein